MIDRSMSATREAATDRTTEAERPWATMSIQEISAEQFAELFHRYHQALTHDSEGTNGRAVAPWNQVPEEEKNRLVDAARLALLEIETMERQAQKPHGNYFAKPGEAEWGC